MPPSDDAITLAVIASRLDDVRDDIGQMRGDMSGFAAKHVTRGEWEMRNAFSDSKFSGLGREIGDLRGELRARRAPWWSVAAVLVSAAALLWTLIGPAIIAL